jgi:23S rRNA (adenine2030-N6)-methyltransferase
VPPPERRGLVLIDPPFEAKDEFQRMGDRFAAAFAKWPTGSYLLWYPAKSRRATDDLTDRVADATAASKPPGKLLRIEFSTGPQIEGEGLTSTGLLVVNPPWTLHDELKLLLSELQKPLGQGGAARYRLEFPKP